MLKLEELRPSDLGVLPRDRTVIFLPLGPLEDHGNALPLGLDLIEAEAICRRTAELLTGDGWASVLAPRAALGIDANTTALAIRVRAHVVRDYLVDFCDSLSKQGFRYFIAISGNPGPRQLTAIEEAGKFLRKRHLRFGIFPNAQAPMLVSASSVLLDDDEKSLSVLFMAPPEHGGARDASLAMAYAGDQINEPLRQSLPKIDSHSSLFERWKNRRARTVSGYIGDPAAGTVARGKGIVEQKAKTLAIKFRAAAEGGKPHQIFKSWYSLIPSNQSLFRIWLLVVLLAILLAGWTMLSLQTFMQGTEALANDVRFFLDRV